MLINEIAPFRSVRPGSPYEKRVVQLGDVVEKPPKIPRKKMSPEEKAAKVAERKKEKDLILWRVWMVIQESVGNSVPDGDPIDHIMPRLRRMFGYDRYEWPEQLNKLMDTACRRYGHASDYTDYLAKVWDYYEETNDDSDGIDLYSLTNSPEELPGYDDRHSILRKANIKRKRPNPWR